MRFFISMHDPSILSSFSVLKFKSNLSNKSSVNNTCGAKRS